MTTAINPPCEVCGASSCQTSYAVPGAARHYCAKHGIGLTGINSDYVGNLTAKLANRDRCIATLKAENATLKDRIEQHKMAYQEMAVAHSVQQERAEKAEAALADARDKAQLDAAIDTAIAAIQREGDST